jgi:hypothetical protein
LVFTKRIVLERRIELDPYFAGC